MIRNALRYNVRVIGSQSCVSLPASKIAKQIAITNRKITAIGMIGNRCLRGIGESHSIIVRHIQIGCTEIFQIVIDYWLSNLLEWYAILLHRYSRGEWEKNGRPTNQIKHRERFSISDNRFQYILRVRDWPAMGIAGHTRSSTPTHARTQETPCKRCWNIIG